jgi:hypothetical protein
MSFVKLKKRFFINNKIKTKNNVFYKESDPTTWVYDNYLDSKNVISLVSSESINLFDFKDQNDPALILEKVKEFINDVNNPRSYSVAEAFSTFIGPDRLFFRTYANLTKAKRLSKLKNTIYYTDITNDLIADYRFRNHFKIKKLRSKFLVDDEYVYKKNVIKNNLYKSYREKNLSFYKDLELGFCNYNTLNFFPLNENHSNCVVYANPKISENKNLYEFKKDSFTISFKTIIRKSNTLKKPGCVIHIPGFINVYFVMSENNSNSVRIAVTTSDDTYKNILDINEFTNSIKPGDPNVYTDVVYDNGIVKGSDSEFNLKENFWYNISLKFDKNKNKFSIYTNENLYLETTIVTFPSFQGNAENNVILFGNKIEYTQEFIDNTDSGFIFDNFFNRDLERSPLINKDIYVPVNFENQEGFQLTAQDDFLKISNSEYFCGEISDIRIYSQKLPDDKIRQIEKNYISSISEEINSGLVFYVPVMYIPLEVKAKQIVNLSGQQSNMKYNNYYNTCFANTCGGFIINATNYLVEFVNSSKPNVVINGNDIVNIYSNDYENKISDFVSENDPDIFYQIRKGNSVSEIIHDSFDVAATQSCIHYNNLLILPNDNGIPKVSFEIIKEFVEERSPIPYSEKFFYSFDKEKLYYNISIENISLNEDNFISDTITGEKLSTNRFTLDPEIINDNGEIIRMSFTDDGSFTDFLKSFSILLYHDARIESFNTDDMDGVQSFVYRKSGVLYNKTLSNPSTRNLFADDIDFDNATIFFRDNDLQLDYYQLPLPYADINKDFDSYFCKYFDISKVFYDKKIIRKTFQIKDEYFYTGNTFNIKDNGLGVVHRADCNSKIADWNYIGHIFYNEGIITLNNPIIGAYFCGGVNSDFEISFKSESCLNVKEINVPTDAGTLNASQNSSYDNELRHNEAAFNSEESFVYITDINLHDENFNIVARTKLARPIPKKDSDKMIFKLKMDY